MTVHTSHTTLAIILVLGQAVLYSAFWLWNEYIATLFTLIFPAVILVILVLSTIADWIEPSRISKWYYIYMIISIITPLVIGAIFYSIYSGQLDWLSR